MTNLPTNAWCRGLGSGVVDQRTRTHTQTHTHTCICTYLGIMYQSELVLATMPRVVKTLVVKTLVVNLYLPQCHA